MIVMMYRLTPHSWGFLFVGGWVDLEIILWKSLLNYFLGEHISKKFKKALREIDADENKSFHSLRDTFTVRKLIQGAYIYHLKLIMGHASVTTTEIYSNMNLKRVLQDFPTIVSTYVNNAKIGKKDTILKDINTMHSPYLLIYQELQAWSICLLSRMSQVRVLSRVLSLSSTHCN